MIIAHKTSVEEVAVSEDEIRGMEAGRRLDALIAEKLMGWHWVNSPPDIDGNYEGIPILIPPNLTLNDLEPVLPKRGPVGHVGIPRFSTDIGSAWQLVERLATMEGPVSIAWGIYGSEGNKASVVTMYGPGPGVVAPTAPLAICRAALLAVERI